MPQLVESCGMFFYARGSLLKMPVLSVIHAHVHVHPCLWALFLNFYLFSIRKTFFSFVCTFFFLTFAIVKYISNASTHSKYK